MKSLDMSAQSSELDENMRKIVAQLLTPEELDLVVGAQEPDHDQNNGSFTQGPGCDFDQGGAPYGQNCGS